MIDTVQFGLHNKDITFSEAQCICMLIVVVVEELIIVQYILTLSAIASVVNIVMHMHMNDWHTVEFGLHNPIKQWIFASHEIYTDIILS